MDQMGHRPDEMAGYLDFLMHRRRVESSSTLLQHFGFREDPFRVNPDARYLFPSQTHLQALSALENGFYNNRGFIAMIAPPGMGKTTLLYRFLEDTKESARSIFIFDIDAECKPRDFVGYILRDFGIKPSSSSSEMHKQLSEALINETEAGRKCVVVIDEAQNLSDDVLERVRLLTNFENSQGKLLQIILSGQPQLTDKLKKASLVQLRQRVSTICRLDLLTPEETKDYIQYRLGQAGYEGPPLFTSDALDLIAEMGGGTPRTINNLCFNILAMCSAVQAAQADREMVAKVVEAMELDEPAHTALELNSASGSEIETESEPWRMTGTQGWLQAASGEVRVWVPLLFGVVVFAGLIFARVMGLGAAKTNKADERIAASSAAPVHVPDATDVAEKVKPVQNTGSALPESSRSAYPSALSNTKPKVPADAATGSAPKPITKPSRAFLSIDSNPPGADIVIDGKFVGNAPSSIAIIPGPHEIYVEKTNYKNWSKTVIVTGGNLQVNAELEPITAEP
jgi:general secretion pathway protein A